eukprot:GHVP01058496.1.p1 GENE.GHVP01058496.1~~GHVP01058496.1.p1  ORF type:complete len:209 (+),score=62.34 GHVP01058496.1:421-1047(+)
MTFGDLTKEKGLMKLNDYLETRSYIEGYEGTVADLVVLESLLSCPDFKKYPHASRWYEHIVALSSSEQFKGERKNIEEYGPEEVDDIFGSDSEEDPEETAAKEQRLKEYLEKKSKKPVEAAKSSIVLDIKPWDDETNMDELEVKVRNIELDGLVWGASKKVPVGYGILKLQINLIIEDDKVSVGDLEELIAANEDNVQSVDVFSFNKV